MKNYVFVGSAGAYAANDVEPMHVEGDKRKSSAGHVKVEAYLEEQGLPYTVFQPLCERWAPLGCRGCFWPEHSYLGGLGGTGCRGWLAAGLWSAALAALACGCGP